MSAADRQSLTLTVREGLVLRGAINVVLELLERPAFSDVVERVPVVPGQRAILERLVSQLDNRIESASNIGTGQFDEQLEPDAAQAIRDVIMTFDELRQSESGREVLALIGVLNDSSQPFDMAEAAALQEVLDQVDPTGVRPTPGPSSADRGPTEIVSPTDPIPDVIEQAIRDVDEQVFPWPGAEQAEIMLRDIQDAASEERDIGCDNWLRNVVQAGLLVGGAVRNLQDDRQLMQAIIDNAGIAHGGALGNAAVLPGCLPADSVEDLHQRWTDLVESRATAVVMTARDRQVRQFMNGLRAYLRTLRERVEDVGRGSGRTDQRARAGQSVLQDITNARQRASEQFRDPRPLEAIQEAAQRIRERVLDDIDRECIDYVPHLTTLAMLNGEAVRRADLDQVGGVDDEFDPATTQLLVDAFRSVMSRLLEENCLESENEGRLLRNDFLDIHDPAGEAEQQPFVERVDTFLLRLRQFVERHAVNGNGNGSNTTTGP